jgi:hypothetical protein
LPPAIIKAGILKLLASEMVLVLGAGFEAINDAIPFSAIQLEILNIFSWLVTLIQMNIFYRAFLPFFRDKPETESSVRFIVNLNPKNSLMGMGALQNYDLSESIL